jgi:ubiquinone/menaquinone biosynthesis C-methylase UbiE
MLLNAVEKALMNNPVRAAVQRRFEARRLFDLGGSVVGGRVLEIGCGRGVGIDIILSRFGAGSVDAFDLDPDMVARARARHAARGREVRLWVGDAEKIRAGDGTYDAVFDFGIIHHVPAWRNALREVARVLKPGGRLYAEEVLARFIHHPVWRRVLDHPMEDRFDRRGFEAGLVQAGLTVLGSNQLLGSFAWFVADKPREAVAMAMTGVVA